MSIHPTAIIGENARIGSGTEIGPYAVVEDDAVVGEDCYLGAHTIVRGCAELEDVVRVDSFAVIGGDPQSLTFDPSTNSGIRVERNVTIREGCTLHRASAEGGETVIGRGSFLMAQAHVAHDCVLGEEVVLCNNAMLGGHVRIADRAFIGGGVGIHQFCRVGAHAMIGGNASVSLDVPPYVTVAGRNRAHGLNLIGLRRAGFTQNEIADLKRCYRAVLAGGGNMRHKAAEATREHEFGTTSAGVRFLSFFEGGSRGFVQAGAEPGDASGTDI